MQLIRWRDLRRLRNVAVLLLGTLCACRTAPRRTCYAASGREVWVERHLRAQGSGDGRLLVEVAPDDSIIVEAQLRGAAYRAETDTLMHP